MKGMGEGGERLMGNGNWTIENIQETNSPHSVCSGGGPDIVDFCVDLDKANAYFDFRQSLPGDNFAVESLAEVFTPGSVVPLLSAISA